MGGYGMNGWREGFILYSRLASTTGIFLIRRFRFTHCDGATTSGLNS
jgi:hypothetical protein